MGALPRTGLLAAVLCLPLAGCGSGSGSGVPTSVAVTTYPGLPSGVRPPALPTLPTAIAVLQPGDRLALTFWGSGSCPTLPVAVDVVSRHEIRVTVDDTPSGACTADFRPTTSVVQLDGTRVDTTTDLVVNLSAQTGPRPALTAHPAR
jgi:hypothetical protein